MKEEYTQIVDMLQKAADEIETPPFEERYKAIESKLGPVVYDKANVQKKKSFHKKWKSPFMIASYVCAVLAISLGLGFGLGYTNDRKATEKGYFIKDIIYNLQNNDSIEAITKNEELYLPKLVDKQNIMFYTITAREDNEFLGYRFEFTLLSDNDYFTANIEIFSKRVIDSTDSYKTVSRGFKVKDINLKYEYIDNDGTFYNYIAMFEHGDYNYLIDYNSISEDFEQGIATIF